MAGALCASWSAQTLAEPLPYVAEAARQAEPARPVGVLVPQVRLASSIELGRIMFPSGGGGALGAIIIAGNNDIPQRLAEAALERAETRIAPVRTALGEFDAANLAGEATRAALGGAEWLGSSPPEMLTMSMGNDAGEERPVLLTRTYRAGLWGYTANESEAGQAWADDVNALQRQFDESHPDAAERAQVQWRYQLSPDFSQVQVFADVSIRRSGAIEPYYAQQVISVVRLNRPSYIEEDNAARWAANDATLTRRALEMAFARAGEVLPLVLALDQAGFANASDKRRESVTSAGYHGPVLSSDDKGPVFWAEDGDQRLAAFVAVQSIRE